MRGQFFTWQSVSECSGQASQVVHLCPGKFLADAVLRVNKCMYDMDFLYRR